jgi:hypothetical protein
MFHGFETKMATSPHTLNESSQRAFFLKKLITAAYILIPGYYVVAIVFGSQSAVMIATIVRDGCRILIRRTIIGL